MNSAPYSPLVRDKIANFLDRYGKLLSHHANYLDAVEQRAEERREVHGEESTSDAGRYSRQGRALRDVRALFLQAEAEEVSAPADALARAELRESFSLAVGALNMIIREHADFNKRLVRRSDAEGLEQRYRKRHALSDGEELDPAAMRRIRRTARANAKESREMTHEITELSDMKAAMLEIQELMLAAGPPRRQAGGGMAGLG